MQQVSEKSMNNSPTLGSIVEEKPSTIPPPAMPKQRYSPPKNISTESLERAPLLQSQCPDSAVFAQTSMLMTLPQALYLLTTGKLVQIPNVLLNVTLLDLFNHFRNELIADEH